ncbi:helix-turn-helix domain-containing protein [Pedobacter sp. P351]|uniref:AraC family transcriptional regulator n=1 Tax=Pedobacter superstes TaxID=3133441 RepID=UPI0030B5BE5F
MDSFNEFDQVFDWVIISGTFLILLFSLHLFFSRQKYRFLNRLIAVVLFARVGQNVLYVLIKSGDLVNLPFLLHFFNPFSYAAPACLFLYVNCIVKKKSEINKIEWLHFIPALLAVIEALPWYFSSVSWGSVTMQMVEDPANLLKMTTGYFPYYYHLFFRPVLFIIYLLFTWYILLQSKILVSKKEGDKSIGIWLLSLMIIISLVQIVRIIPVFINRPELFVGVQINAQWYTSVNAVIFLFIVLYILYRPDLLYKYILVSDKFEVKAVNSAAIIQTEENSNKIISSELGDVYLIALEEFMKGEKPFLNHDFQIMNLAQALKIPIHHCSFVINTLIGNNFRDWVNSYRIKYFIDQFPVKANQMTIEAIANDSGFKSSTTFYRAFKKETGKMPKSYFKV